MADEYLPESLYPCRGYRYTKREANEMASQVFY